MNIQYISDNDGLTTGVFIPISEWNELKSKYEGIEDLSSVAQWQIREANARYEYLKSHPESAEDLDAVLDKIEKQ